VLVHGARPYRNNGSRRARRIGAIEPGADFAQEIDEAVGSCDVLLAVIGPAWATVTDARGRRRLDDPDDFVALAVGTALPRPEVKVILVLVDGARMPMQEELPPALAVLGRRQAIELSAARWRYDVETLLRTLERALGGAALAAGEQPPITEPERTVARGEAVPVPWPMRSRSSARGSRSPRLTTNGPSQCQRSFPASEFVVARGWFEWTEGRAMRRLTRKRRPRWGAASLGEPPRRRLRESRS
jgi:hypothetical protein